MNMLILDDIFYLVCTRDKTSSKILFETNELCHVIKI